MSIRLLDGRKKPRDIERGKQETVRGLLAANKIQIGPRDKIYIDNISACLKNDRRGAEIIEIIRNGRVIQKVVSAGDVVVSHL